MASSSSPIPESQAFCIKRTDKHSAILFNSFREIFEDESLFDCSLICEGKVIRGHRFLLAAASPYFRAAINSFTNQHCHNTAIIVPEVPYDDLKAIIDFLYRGEVIIDDKQVTSLQKSVETLKVTCLLLSSSSSNQSVCKISQPLSSLLSKSSKNCSNTVQASSAIYSGNGVAGGSNNGGHERSSPLFTSSSPSANNLPNGSDSHGHLRGHQLLHPSFFSNRRSPSHMLKVITPSTGPAKVIYQPHEPFVQLRELLKRGPNSNKQLHFSQHYQAQQQSKQSAMDKPAESSPGRDLTDSDQIDRKDGYLSGDDLDIDLDQPKNDDSVRLDSDLEENGASEEDSRDVRAGYGSNQQIIDMRVNSSSNQKSGFDDELDSHFDHSDRDNLMGPLDNPSNECIDIEVADKLLSPSSISNPSKSYAGLPLSVSIATSFNSATARAIAASTTLAVASGLLSNANGPINDHHPNHRHLLTQDKSLDGDGQQLLPLKRGRGRPPRHLRDDEPSGQKTYKVRPILPSASSDLSPPGIIISSEPSLNPMIKKKKISLDTLMALKGRKQKLLGQVNNGTCPPGSSSGSADPTNNGKNVCPYCPQVYYSNQAMNDHINNVHTGNAIKYTCDICSKEFSWKISLTKHLRNTHKQEKPENESNNLNSPNDRKSMFINF